MWLDYAAALWAKGLGTQEIAIELMLSESSVYNRLDEIHRLVGSLNSHPGTVAALDEPIPEGTAAK